MADATPNTRTSKVTLGVSRTLNTAQYESLEVRLEATEEITWSSLEEREKKIDNVTKLLTDQYTKVQAKVLDEIGVTPKVAWFKSTQRKNNDLDSL